MKEFWENTSLNPDDFYEAILHPTQANWDLLYKDYDAALDWPTVTFYKHLLIRYPTAKVILTIRSADSWYESVKKTIHKNALLRESWKSPSHPKHAYYRMVYHACMHGMITDPENFNRQDQVKQLYLDHIEDVKLNVPADQLLIIELGEGWDRLCKFLGKEVPNIPYPKVNNVHEFEQYFKAFNNQ